MFAGSEVQGAGGDRQVEEDQDGEDAVVEQQQGPELATYSQVAVRSTREEASSTCLRKIREMWTQVREPFFLLADPRYNFNTQL